MLSLKLFIVHKIRFSLSLQSTDTDKTLQKKLYRVLEEICAASTEDCKRFVSSNESQLVKLLLESIVSTSPPSLAVSAHR